MRAVQKGKLPRIYDWRIFLLMEKHKIHLNVLGNDKIVLWLIQNRADINSVDIFGKTPLQWAIEKSDSKIYMYIFSRIRR